MQGHTQPARLRFEARDRLLCESREVDRSGVGGSLRRFAQRRQIVGQAPRGVDVLERLLAAFDLTLAQRALRAAEQRLERRTGAGQLDRQLAPDRQREAARREIGVRALQA